MTEVTAYEWDTPTPDQLAARKRWVELLRSGEFEQLKGRLSAWDGKQRCCLGVACDPRVTGVELAEEKYTHPDGRFFRVFDDELAVLPFRVSAALGFNKAPHDGGYNPPTLRGTSLAEANDAGTPFSEIADLIEATYITPHVNTEG